MQRLTINRHTFDSLMLSQLERVIGFLQRYFGVSPRETRTLLWAAILDGCWEKALADETLMNNPKRLAKNSAKDVATAFLKANGYFANV